MKLTYFDVKKTAHLVDHFYHITYSDKIIPYNTIIMPLGVSGFTFIYGNSQKAALQQNETQLKNLMLNGQFYKSYNFIVNEAGFSCGFSLKPTTLYKLTNLDISKFTNKHSDFNQIDLELSSKFETVFKAHDNNFVSLFNNLENLIINLPLIENKDTLAIDNAIDYIHEKKGMLSVIDLLKKIPFSQKKLETKFKKIVGLTPAKYIRIQRFLNLMKQYENNKIPLKDLIYIYDYYDESHFSRDFKSFTSKSPKEYFIEDFSLIKEALKK